MSSLFGEAKKDALNFWGELKLGEAAKQFGLKLASDFVDNNKGGFGFWGWMADKFENWFERPDLSNPNGKVASVAHAIAPFFLPGPKGLKAAKGVSKAPDFIVSPNGTAFPVPKGAQGPVPVVNPAGKQTGVAYTGAVDKKVDTIRIMNPTPARGASPGYPNGYIKYENATGQGVNPLTGRTVLNTESHFPVQ